MQEYKYFMALLRLNLLILPPKRDFQVEFLAWHWFPPHYPNRAMAGVIPNWTLHLKKLTYCFMTLISAKICVVKQV